MGKSKALTRDPKAPSASLLGALPWQEFFAQCDLGSLHDDALKASTFKELNRLACEYLRKYCCVSWIKAEDF